MSSQSKKMSVSLCVGFFPPICEFCPSYWLWPLTFTGRLMSVILQLLDLSWILCVFSQLVVNRTFKCHLLISIIYLSHSIFTLSYRGPRPIRPTGVSRWPGGHLPNEVFQVFNSLVKALCFPAILSSQLLMVLTEPSVLKARCWLLSSSGCNCVSFKFCAVVVWLLFLG